MKWIREYNTYKNNKIQELEDYLQEFFDKFRIPFEEEEEEDPFKHEYEEDIQIYYSLYSSYIFIANIPPNGYTDMLSEIKRIQPNIEKRLGTHITITEYDCWRKEYYRTHSTIYSAIKIEI